MPNSYAVFILGTSGYGLRLRALGCNYGSGLLGVGRVKVSGAGFRVLGLQTLSARPQGYESEFKT